MSKTKKKSGSRSLFRGGLSEMMRQAHRMQEKLEAVKEEMKTQTWTVDAAGGKIQATINGAKELTAVRIDPELVTPDDIETLQDVVVSVVNAAIAKADEELNAATTAVTKGVKIPGLV